jgi:daunorubicin resistance ABC transporter membrane protein
MERALPSTTTAPARARPSALRLNLAAIGVLLRRDLKRFFRQRSRVAGALVQPLIFWLVIGAGLAGSFRIPGASEVGYVQYFYPGIIVLVVLFTSIFTTMSVIEDRQGGFLQAVLVSPASRVAVVLGKTLGGVTVALVQAALFLALAPFAGFPLAAVDWPLIAAALLATSVALAALGFALAWWLNSTQGYHVVMSVLLIPLWVLSGAMFPQSGAHGGLATAMRWNPVAYSVAALRRGLYGTHYEAIASQVGVGASSTMFELAVVTGFALIALLLAARLCARRA